MSDTLDYKQLIKRFPWIVTRGQDCIVSPDVDGLLCGLFMAHYLGWRIRGFYDAKVLVKHRGINARDCIFLDVEIFRKGTRSVGQHMLMYDIRDVPRNWEDFSECISANNLRNHDFKHNFKQKYPLATIHLLLAILGSVRRTTVPTRAVSVLLYADGTFKNLFNYPENCLSWLQFLSGTDKANPLRYLFHSVRYPLTQLMGLLSDLFKDFRAINAGRRGGDKIKISNTRGEVVNFDARRKTLDSVTLEKANALLNLLAHRTGWIYKPGQWAWSDLEAIRFQKAAIRPSRRRYEEFIKKRPLSFAITSSLALEYTLDPKRKFI